MDEMHSITHRLRHAEADLAYSLDCFGDHLAEREGYKAHKGIDAVHYFLVLKFGWTPAQVRTMHPEDVRFAMEEEMAGWLLPKEARTST